MEANLRLEGVTDVPDEVSLMFPVYTSVQRQGVTPLSGTISPAANISGRTGKAIPLAAEVELAVRMSTSSCSSNRLLPIRGARIADVVRTIQAESTSSYS